MKHYFDQIQDVQSVPVNVSCWCESKKLIFQTDHGVFSYGRVDEASYLLVESFPKLEHEKVLDLGCGYGLIGIYLKTKYPDIQLTQIDINERAVECCKQNAKDNGIASTILQSDAFESLADAVFDVIVLNPPIHAGKEVCEHLYAQSYHHLNKGGTFAICIRKKHGAESTIASLTEIGFQVDTVQKEKGIWLLFLKKD